MKKQYEKVYRGYGMVNWLKQGERFDDLNRNGYKIIQNAQKFCFGMDAVLLSGFAKVKEEETVLDLGTGSGIIPILLRGKTRGKHFTGLEIDSENVDMARRSVAFNKLSEDIEIVEGDIKEVSNIFKGRRFQVVTSNPPYMANHSGLLNERYDKAIARHEILCTLEDVIREGAKLLSDDGRFYMVHRPYRLSEIFSICIKYKLEPKRLRFVYPYVDKEPNMVLIGCVKGGRTRLTVEPPLIVYNAQDEYSEEMKELYGF